MAKTSKKKENEPISINTIYETIKDGNFAQELWMDIISDIGNKPTYKRIKEMVSCVLNDTLKNFDTEPADNSERLERRGIFTEISIMAYTVDRVISEFLHKRLQNEFKQMIKVMLEEIQTKKKDKKDESPPEINSMFENIESIFTKNDEVGANEGSVNVQQAEATQRPVRKRGRPKKSAIPSDPSTSKSSSTDTAKTGEKLIEDNIFKIRDCDLDSNISFTSFSTSELSSFDDNISICTDDGKRKKHIPAEIAKKLFQEGNIPDCYILDESLEDNKKKRENVSRKVLPKRKRKPNSRYNAETMYCQVKDYSSPHASSLSGEVSEDSCEGLEEASNKVIRKVKRTKISSKDSSHTKRRKISSKKSAGSASKSLKISNEKNTDLAVKHDKITYSKSADSLAARRDKMSNGKSTGATSTKRTKPFHNKSNKSLPSKPVGKGEDLSPSKPVTTRSSRNDSPAINGHQQNIPVPASSSTPIKNTAQRYTSSELYKPRFHFGHSSKN